METDSSLPELKHRYSWKWFTRRKKLDWRGPIIANALVEVWSPESVYDVGCGNGVYVQYLLNQSVNAWGIEPTQECLSSLSMPVDRLLHLDLRFPWLVEGEKVDLAVCLEVAEHIDEPFADTFVDNLSAVSDQLVFSAAPPGGKGHHHVNCQLPEYWKQKFLARGYIHDEVHERLWLEALAPWKHRKEINAYRRNGICFKRIIDAKTSRPTVCPT